MECILVGDTGSGYKEQLLVAESMVELIQSEPEIKCVMIVGDNIYPDGCYGVKDRQFIDKFQNPYKNIHLPFYLCLGNHDYSPKWGIRAQIDYTKSKENVTLQSKLKKWNLPREWYTQSFPQCDFFMINTNMDQLTEDSIDKQLQDTVQAIKHSKKRWKILCGHHTWRSVGGHGNATSDMPHFETFMKDLLAEVKIDLYVCGHDHCKSIIEVGDHKTPTLVIGTGGKQYDEDLYYPDNMKADGSKLKFFSSELGVCHFKATKDSIILTCYTETLRKEKTYTISKRSKKTNSRGTKRRTRRRKRSRRRRRRN